MKKVKEWLCKIFGHKYSDVDRIIYALKSGALNSKELQPVLVCRRCKSRHRNVNHRI